MCPYVTVSMRWQHPWQFAVQCFKRDGKHGIGNAVSINVMARCRARGKGNQEYRFINYVNV